MKTHTGFLIFILTTPIYASEYIDELGVERAQDWSVGAGTPKFDGLGKPFAYYDYITGMKISVNYDASRGWISKEAYRAGAKTGLEEKCKNRWDSFGLKVFPDDYTSIIDPNFNAGEITQFNTSLTVSELNSERSAGKIRSKMDLVVAEYRSKCKPFSLEKHSKIKWLLGW